MPERAIDPKAVSRADISGTTRIERDDAEVVEVRKLERLKARVRDQDGRTAFAVEIRAETQEFALLPSETWCTAAMIDEIREVLVDIETVFRKVRG